MSLKGNKYHNSHLGFESVLQAHVLNSCRVGDSAVFCTGMGSPFGRSLIFGEPRDVTVF
jgi:hypothetical protein